MMMRLQLTSPQKRASVLSAAVYPTHPPVSAPAAEIINLSRISAASARNLAGGQMLRRLRRLDEVVNEWTFRRPGWAGPGRACRCSIVQSGRAEHKREQRRRHGNRGRWRISFLCAPSVLYHSSFIHSGTMSQVHGRADADPYNGLSG